MADERRYAAVIGPGSCDEATAALAQEVGAGLAGVVMLHLLRPDLGVAHHRMSEYAFGPYASLMTAAFVSIGAGVLALAWPIARAGGRWSRAVPVALVGFTPKIDRSSSLRPAPIKPKIPTTSPRWTSKVRSFWMTTSPHPTVRSLTRMMGSALASMVTPRTPGRSW